MSSRYPTLADQNAAPRLPPFAGQGADAGDPHALHEIVRAWNWLDQHGENPLVWTRLTGESARDHGRGVDEILLAQGADLVTRLIGLLVCSQPPPDEMQRADWFGAEFARTLSGLLGNSSRLLSLSVGFPANTVQAGRHQAETVRRMTLAMAKDVRVVIVRLASGLQTLKRLVADGLEGREAAQAPAGEALTILAPLANRLGLFRLKWEMEDLAFRCSQPEVYHALAGQLESSRHERERFIAEMTAELSVLLQARGIVAQVSGRPKHLYSIRGKLLDKRLQLAQLHDLRAVRVLVKTLTDCYGALGVVHQRWAPVVQAFDDYIAKPKANGYRSLHTVVTADDGKTLEVQIRTSAMHEQAEYGVAAHWRYKERITSASDDQAVRLAWLRQLLAWQQDQDVRLGAEEARTTDDSRIFALTPQGNVIELPAGATPLDFAYHLHSNLGHRCRGAKVDGRIVPLNTPLANGQVVEITAARDTGATSAAPGPSRDWLNPALGYLRSHRARTKVRQWFNAQQRDLEAAAGRERVEKALAREGRTSLSFDELAARLGQSSAAAMFAGIARETIGARALEDAIRSMGSVGAAIGQRSSEATSVGSITEVKASPRSGARPGGNAVLVVGVDFLLTQLGRCCHPAPPDAIIGFVTRGKGVTTHRKGCGSLRQMAQRSPERLLEASWGDWERPARGKHGHPVERRYPVAVQINATDRPGLLRDVTEVFARERANVLSVRSNTRGDLARFHFVVEVSSVSALDRVMSILGELRGVEHCSRG